MKHTFAAVILVFFIAPIPVLAKSHTCAQMVNGLQPGIQQIQPGSTADFTDYGSLLMAVLQTHPQLCVPNMQLSVLEAAFLHWADLNPNLLTMDAWDCAARAFSEMWPCAPAQQFHKG